MAMPRRINVEFGDVFPHGAWAVSDIEPMRDYDKSSKDNQVQATDDESGLPVWTVDVIDADEDTRKADRQVSVRVSAKVCPVLPPTMGGTPFRPIEFSGMAATPYVVQQGDSRPRIAWSYRATDLNGPKTGSSKQSSSQPSSAAA